ncbi:helix-turn-helix domain-containing protein [Raoultibacter phocaeensis]|uniref:helix-turn-helix domain-containing protein n=1 Tax=Raoultibacter phocaeensis TaxID=2479841 RepID=UPI001119EBFB
MNVTEWGNSTQETCRIIYASERPPVHCAPLEGYGDLLSISDLQEITNLSAQTLRSACRQKRLPAIKIGRRYFVFKTLFVQFLEEGAHHVSH